MKWIFALNADSVAGYGDLARVAVVSARRNTSLQAVCLFDGEEGQFTDWLRSQGVEVVQVRSRFYDDIARVAAQVGNMGWLRVGSGAFLRLEIPRIARELGWTDEFVFYTDCDVIFERDPRPFLEPLRPRLFAACSEASKKRMLDLNTGAMWMNLKALDDPAFGAWTRANMARLFDFAFDQGAFRVFYNPPRRLAWRLGIPASRFYRVMARVPIRTWKWDKLPLELNWKPYWGPNPDACIIHFHGLKPNQRAELEAGIFPPFIAQMRTPFWDECVIR